LRAAITRASSPSSSRSNAAYRAHEDRKHHLLFPVPDNLLLDAGSIVARLMANTATKKMSVSKTYRVPWLRRMPEFVAGRGRCMLVLGQGNILAVVVKHVLDSAERG